MRVVAKFSAIVSKDTSLELMASLILSPRYGIIIILVNVVVWIMLLGILTLCTA